MKIACCGIVLGFKDFGRFRAVIGLKMMPLVNVRRKTGWLAFMGACGDRYNFPII